MKIIMPSDDVSDYIIVPDFHIFDDLEDIVFIADYETDYFVYVNIRGRLIFPDYSSKQVSDYFNKKNAFCNGKNYLLHKKRPTDLLTWDFINPEQKRTYRISCAFIKHEEKICRLLIVKVLSEEGKAMTLQFKKENEFLAEITRSIVDEANPIDAMNKVLPQITRYFECSRTTLYLFRGSGKEMEVAYGGSYPRSRRHKEYEDVICSGEELSVLKKYLKTAQPFLLSHLPSADGKDHGALGIYNKVIGHKAKNVVICPTYVSKQLVGFIALENISVREGANYSLLFGSIVRMLATTIRRKGMLDVLNRDAKTGIHLTSYLQLNFEKIMLQNKGNPLCFVEFTADALQNFVNFYGEEKGDQLQQNLVDYLNGDSDIIVSARQKFGDHYFLIVKGKENEAEALCKRIHSHFSEMYPEISLRFRFGVYELPDARINFTYAEDKAHYALKVALKDNLKYVHFFNAELQKVEQNRHDIVFDFERALEKGEFVPYVQPKYNIEKKTYCGGEVLVRWIKNGKLISPGVFIPIFEQYGQIHELDRYMLIQTCKILRNELDTRGKALPLSFNYSRIDFYDKSIFEKTIHIIDQYQIPHDLIQIEITESAFVELEGRIKKFLAQCREANIKVLMDDFGSGYSSLNSLKELDISILKLDCRFLEGFGHDIRNQKIIESVVGLARSLNLPIIIEGVETVEEASYFGQIGVRYIQGYLYGKPMPVLDYEKLTDKGEAAHDDLIGYRNLLDHLQNPSSNSNYLFRSSLEPMAVFKVMNGEASLLMSNKAFQDINFPMQRKVVPYEEGVKALGLDNQGFDEFLSEAPSTGFPPATGTFNVRFGQKIQKTVIGINRLGVKSEHINYYLVQLNFSSNYYSVSSDFQEISLQTIALISDSLSCGVFVVDEQDEIIYSNPTMKKMNHECVERAKVSEVFPSVVALEKVSIMIPDSEYLFYSQKMQMNVLVNTTVMHLNGRNIYLVMVQKNEGGSDSDFSANDFFQRLYSGLYQIIQVYTEVNITKDTYIQVFFGNKQAFPNRATGNYESSFRKALLTIDPLDQENVIGKASLAGLREAYQKQTKRYWFSYKDARTPTWSRCFVTFSKKGDDVYALIYTVDATSTYSRGIDYLTDLLNKDEAKKLINDYIFSNVGKKIALLVADIDGLKDINVVDGYDVGDYILHSIGQFINSLPHESFRYGVRLSGNKLGVLITDEKYMKDKMIREPLDSFCSKVSKSLNMRSRLHLTYGLSYVPEDGRDFESLFIGCDKAIYKAKHKKNR